MKATCEQVAAKTGTENLVIGPKTAKIDRAFVLWAGQFVTVHVNGYIVSQWLRRWAREFDCHFVCCRTDGVVYLTDAEIAAIDAKFPHFVIPVLCGKISEPLPKRCFRIPPDDGLAQYGIGPFFLTVPAFVGRRDCVFWRGGCSGNGLRLQVVRRLAERPRCDVRLIARWRADNPNYARAEDRYFGEPTTPAESLQYRYLLMIDGNSLAGNSAWVLASGAVPILIGEWKPFWYEQATPWKNFVPVRADLADLEENLERLTRAPEIAEWIATNARMMALITLSPGRQFQMTRQNFLDALHAIDS